MPGVVLNALALLFGGCGSLGMAVPLLKLLFAGALMSPAVAVLVAIAGFALLWVAPIAGLVLAWTGRARGPTVLTALASLCCIIALASAAQAVGGPVVSERGRASGPKPERCAPVAADSTAIGRACHPDGGPTAEADCPEGYFCLPPIVNRPDENACLIPCRHDCECPDGLSCVFEKCKR